MTEKRRRAYDTGPLSAFANAGLLGVLKILSAEHECVLLDEVADELRNGRHVRPALDQALGADWLTPASLTSETELLMFSEVAQFLMGPQDRDRGETAVIAWARAHPGAQVVLDDLAARRVAVERYNIPCVGSIGIIIDAIKQKLLAHDMANALADELRIAGGARLPFAIGGFISWAESEDVL